MPDPQGTEFRHLAAIMFTDMVGYSALAQQNEGLAMELIDIQHQLLRPLFPKFQGREIKSTGDGFLIEFASALAGTLCAIEIQKTLAAYNATVMPERRINVRIGVHLGDVVYREADMYGDGVNIAARIEPLAQSGGICLSGPVVDQVQNKIGVSLVKLGTPELKNIQVPLEVYRVVLPWHGAAPSQPAPPARRAPSTRQRNVAGLIGACVGLGAIVFLVAASIFFFSHRSGRNASEKVPRQGATAAERGTSPPAALPGLSPITSLAVLPLVNMSGNPEQEYFVDGITELLCTELAALKALKKVTSRTTVMQYKKSSKKVPEIASELGVQAVVEGSVQREGNQVLVSVQLIDGASDRHLWATNYERELSSVLKLKTELARVIAGEIKAQLTPEEQSRLTSARQRNPAALENYLKGRHFLNEQTEEGLRTAINYFEQALRIEPDYAEAYAGVAQAYALLSSVFVAPRQVMPLAQTNALKALQLNGELAEGHHVSGLAKLLFAYDFSGGKKDFERALSLNPNYAEAHDGYAMYLQVVGRVSDALREDETAARLDPLSMVINGNYVSTFMTARQYERGIQTGKEILKLQKDNHLAAAFMSFCYSLARDPLDGIRLAEPICRLDEKERPYMILGALAYAYATAGQMDAARRALTDLERISREKYICAYEVAIVHSSLGDNDAAFQWLYKALEARADCIAFTKIDPRLDPLHSDPRFAKLLKDIGFPE